MRLLFRLITVISVLFALFVSPSNASSADDQGACMPTSGEMQNVNLLPFIHHYWDANNEIATPSFEHTHQLQSTFRSIEFQPANNPANEYILGAGNSNHWIRFCLTNPSSQPQQLVLAASPAIAAEVDLYPQKPGLAAFKTGNSFPMHTRDLYSPEFHFSVLLQANESQYYYMRLRSRTNAYLIAAIWDKQSYVVAQDKVQGLDGVFAGVLLGLILYTMLLYFSVRQSSSLLYILWSTSTLILFASIDGRILQYLLPNTPSLAYTITVIFYPLCVILSALFAKQFIRLADYPLLNKIGYIIVGLFIIFLVAVYPTDYVNYFRVNGAFAFTVVLYFGLIAPLYCLIAKKSVLARYLLIAQFPLIICVLDRALFTMGVTSEHYVPYTAKVGLVAEMILLAYCIGLTIYREKNEAQRLALEQLALSNELKSSYNAELEAELERNTADIRSMNKDLEQQAKQLIELDEVKSQFFANISHEFRTPLTLIQGPLADLIQNGSFDDNSVNVVHGAIQQSKSLQRLIDQLLTLSKFDADALMLQASKVDINQLVRTITAQFDSLAQTSNIKLEFTSKIPSLRAYVDQDKLQVILNNLLSNAIKFTPTGGTVGVTVSATVDTDDSSGNANDVGYANDEYLVIEVSDTGHGIPNNELASVFERFFQSKTSAQVGSGLGTGIGLALTKELVELHAGTITVSSVHEAEVDLGHPSSGSTFRIELPLGRAHLNANEICSEHITQASEPAQPLAKNTLSPQPEPETSDRYDDASPVAIQHTVLVVDDNIDMRQYIRGLLAPNYNVIEAVDGVNAEEVLNQQTPDIIVTDLMMPKRDGLEFLKIIKDHPIFSQIPVIMLTAKAGLDDRLKGLVASVDDYMSKPFDARELQVRIENLLLKQAQFRAFYQASDDQTVVTQSEHQAENELFTQLRAIVESQMHNADFGVTELAQQMHMSKATLHRRLAEESQFTPSAFIRHCRLEAARQLVKEGQIRTVAELANAVGFNQAAYFARLYQKTFNRAPLS